MLGYDPAKKLYLVKRVQMVNILPEWEKEKLSRLNTPADAPKTKTSNATKQSESKSPASHSTSELNKAGSDTRLKKEVKKSKSDSRQVSAKRKISQPPVDSPTEEMEEGTYWVSRVRLMFAAEDPRVFVNRVANAHKARYLYIYNTTTSIMPCKQWDYFMIYGSL